MSRQSRTKVRNRKFEEPKRDVADSNERYSKQNRQESRNEERLELSRINGFDRYRLNDLYERSSL
jgi:hypothetical protein